EQLWAGDQRFCLLCHCFSDHGMGVPETRHAHTGGTVDVFLALVIPQARALAAHDGHTPFGIHPARVAFLDLLEGCHGRSFIVSRSPALAAPAEWGVLGVHRPKSLPLPLAPGPRQPPSSCASSAPVPGPCRMTCTSYQCAGPAS